MSPDHSARLPARTAPQDLSIWIDPTEADFRRAVVQLEKLTNAVPLDSQTFSGTSWINSRSPRPRRNAILSLAEEQCLSNDISFLSAVGEGAQSVAAATIQESLHLRSVDASDGPTLKITVASMDAVDVSSREFLSEIFSSLSVITPPSRAAIADDVLGLIARHHRHRLLNRLRSSRWIKPQYLSRTHKKPLHADIPSLIQRVPITFGRAERSKRRELESRLTSLAATLQDFESLPEIDESGEAAEDLQRLALILACYELCTSPTVSEYYGRLQAARPTSQIQGCLKTLQQIEKIAAYRRISQTLVQLASKYSDLFRNTQLLFLTPYESGPLEIAYQPWASATHVHAEVSLIVHHDLTENPEDWAVARCVGASKYLCYLCYLFVHHHGTFFPSATHGACYDQWTIPDLAEFPERIRQKYREILKGVYSDVLAASRSAVRRPEPMTSRENLLDSSAPC